MKIICLGWKLSREENELLEKIASYIKKKIEGSEVTHIDCFRHTVTDGDHYICFGNDAKKQCPMESWSMFTPKAIIKDKATGLKFLDETIEGIKLRIGTKPKEKTIHIETEEKNTIGKEACEINLTEDEVQYLTMLRNMLKGSTMVIEKGDIRIEVK